MPTEVMLKPGPNASTEIKKQKPRRVAYATAVENVRNSNGAYTFEPISESAAPAVTPLEDMDRDTLLSTAIGLGMKTSKQMKHSEIVAFVRKKMGEIEIVDDE